MAVVEIRPVALPDLEVLAQFWQEHMALRQQTEPAVRLLPDGHELWCAAAARWLEDAACGFFVAVDDGRPVGYIAGWLRDGPPGLDPARYGLVAELVMSLHSYHGGAARQLAQHLLGWFARHGMTKVLIAVPHRSAVQQTFWRSLGAGHHTELMWMPL